MEQGRAVGAGEPAPPAGARSSFAVRHRTPEPHACRRCAGGGGPTRARSERRLPHAPVRRRLHSWIGPAPLGAAVGPVAPVGGGAQEAELLGVGRACSFGRLKHKDRRRRDSRGRRKGRRGSRLQLRMKQLDEMPVSSFLCSARPQAGDLEESLSTVQVPRRIGMMRHMETLSDVQVSDDGTELEGVAKLPQLRKLGVVVPINKNTTKYLRRVISDAVGLRSLSIWATNDRTLDFSTEGVASFSPSNLVLENLDIKGKCSLPPWIDQVEKLRNITLYATDVKGDLLGKLGNVQGLRCLRLLHRSYTDQNSLNFKGGQFKALKFLVVEGDNITSIAFEDNAFPKLEKIVWTIRMDNEKDLISGIHYLRNLKAIELRSGDDFDPTQLFNLKQAIAAHPNRPNFMCWSISRQSVCIEGAGDVTVIAE